MNSEVVEIFRLSKAATNGEYPPPGIEADPVQISDWLGMSARELAEKSGKENTIDNDARLGIFDSDDNLIGYAEVEPVDADRPDRISYWRKAFAEADLDSFKASMSLEDISIMKRGVVLPDLQKHGIGRELLRYLVSEIKESNRVPGIVVLAPLENARRLYDSEGKCVCSFDSILANSSRSQLLYSYLF